jgi:hypothetical protein
LYVKLTLVVIFIFTARGQERNMAAVKSKSGMYCSSKLEDNAQRMNRSKMSFSSVDICLVLISMVTFIVDLSTGEKRFEELLALFVSCNTSFTYAYSSLAV